MRADEYARAAKALDAFLVAFERLRQEVQPVSNFGMSAHWQTKPGRAAQAQAAATQVALLAAAAAEAFDVSGMGIDYKPPGTFQTQAVNPALIWSTMFDERPMVDPQLISVVGAQALGRLEHLREVQAARQRGFVGAIAWFFTLAPRVRDAAGLPARSAPGVVVTWLTVIVQGLIVTVVGGLLVYPIAAALGWT